MLRFLKQKCGVKHIGVAGFCWEGVATHYIALQYPNVKAVVSFCGISVIRGMKSVGSTEDL